MKKENEKKESAAHGRAEDRKIDGRASKNVPPEEREAHHHKAGAVPPEIKNCYK